MNVENYKMKSGKYEGWKLDDIPLSYIAFAYEEWDVSERSREILQKEIWRRTHTWEICHEVGGLLQEKESLRENITEIKDCINHIIDKMYVI